tara:strand:- start:1297 stop:1932 length:636 start_codon:yes stop_codon:yes gene_type:complete
MDRSEQINTFCRFSQVSRETISSLTMYEELLIKANKTLNLIGKSTVSQIWHRHFLDSVQVIDFIDKNDKSIMDLGSGAGFPGLVLAIVLKERKISVKVQLLEKSSKKTKFLNEIIKKLNLDTQVVSKNILEKKFNLASEVFVARAFKPLQKTLELIHSNAKNWKKIFIFLGKTGQAEILQASKSWDIKYKQRMSVTSKDSTILIINSLKRK